MNGEDSVHCAQRTFRALLSALSHPGRIVPIDERLEAPAELGAALAAAVLALVDRDVAVWLAPSTPGHIGEWLVAQTDCRIAASPDRADFAVLLDPDQSLPLARWNAGTAEDPERSATLLVRLESLAGGRGVILSGPGIEHSITAAPRGLPDRFWLEWAANAARYPIGVDCFLFDASNVTGVSRTTVEAGR